MPVTDFAYLATRADECRRLAGNIEERDAAEALLDLAAFYDRQGVIESVRMFDWQEKIGPDPYILDGGR